MSVAQVFTNLVLGVCLQPCAGDHGEGSGRSEEERRREIISMYLIIYFFVEPKYTDISWPPCVDMFC